MPNAQDEERAVCVCLNPFDVIAVALARHLFFGALLILGDVPKVRGDIVNYHRLAVALPANLERGTILELSQKNARACQSGA